MYDLCAANAIIFTALVTGINELRKRDGSCLSDRVEKNDRNQSCDAGFNVLLQRVCIE